MSNSAIGWTVYSAFTLLLYFFEEYRVMGVVLTLLGLIYLYFRKERIANVKKAEDDYKAHQILEKYDKEFEADSEYAAVQYKIAVNEKKEMIKIYKINDDMEISEYPIPFEKIIESEIKMDNSLIYKTSRGSQVAGALVGGALAGGVGAIIGGSSPNMTQNEKVQAITLKVIVDDIKNPNYYFDFLPPITEFHKGYDKSRPEIKIALERCEYWNSIMEIAIRKSNKKLG